MLFTLQRAERFEVAGSTPTLKREQHTRNVFVCVADESRLFLFDWTLNDFVFGTLQPIYGMVRDADDVLVLLVFACLL